MARTNIDQLSSDAHIWIFGISPSLDSAKEATVLGQVDQFLDGWASHGSPIRGARDLREGSFLIIAADEGSEKSGCSIDRMFGTLRQLEQTLGVQILDSNRIFFRENGSGVRAVPRHEFRNVGTPETVVFDVTAEHLGDVRNGRWERQAAQSWHGQLLS
jgi:hypothetical protein